MCVRRVLRVCLRATVSVSSTTESIFANRVDALEVLDVVVRVRERGAKDRVPVRSRGRLPRHEILAGVVSSDRAIHLVRGFARAPGRRVCGLHPGEAEPASPFQIEAALLVGVANRSLNALPLSGGPLRHEPEAC